MGANEFLVDIPGKPGEGVPALKATFGRVTIIMGANGSGKSRLLRALSKHYPGRFGEPVRPVVFIEGGRVMTVPGSVALNRNTINQFPSYDKVVKRHQGMLAQTIAERVQFAFFALERRTEYEKVAHSDRAESWAKAGQIGDYPSRGEAPLDALFRRFRDVFPELELSLDVGKNLHVRKFALSPYEVGSLSDGERQVLGILADMALVHPRSLFFIDEPELNLHPLLADNLWTTLEGEFPDAIFVYATHSIAFAMRESVSRVVVLGHDASLHEFEGFAGVPPALARQFLGAMPAVLAAKGAIGVEGDDASFDQIFYPWVIGDRTVKIVPLGGSEDVKAATTRLGIWKQLASAVAIAGAIDRDFRSDEAISDLAGSCECLEYHEAESYLCEPRLLSALALKIGTAEPLPSESEIRARILAFAAEFLLATAVQRASRRAAIRLGVSLHKKAIGALCDLTQAKKYLVRAAEEEMAKAVACIDAGAIESLLDVEHARASKAHGEEDIRSILALFPGKELLAALAPAVGCANATQVALAASRHLDVADYESLKRLRISLRKRLRLESS
jgi:ABC-type branched-subunit amino acid transport system ATPase component